MRSMWVFAALLFTMGMAPAASADGDAQATTGAAEPSKSAPVDLYFHAREFQDLPLNTQVPEGRPQGDEAVGLPTNSSCVSANPVTTLGSASAHTWYGFISPSYVQYDLDEGGQPRLHLQKGMAYDTRFDADEPIGFHWYIETRAGQMDVPVVPNVQVVAAVVESNDIQVGHERLHQAKVLAEGRSDAVTLSPVVDHPQVTHHEVDGRHVYGFHFPLAFQNATARATEGLGARVTVLMDNPYCADPDDGYVMPGVVALHQSEGLWNRMRVHVHDAVRVESAHVQVIGDDVVIHASAGSPFGAYDVVVPDTLRIQGPATEAEVPRVGLVQRIHEHGHYHEAAKATWVWSVTEETSRGRYTATATVENLQGTAEDTVEAAFEVGDAAITVCQEESPRRDCTTYGHAEEAPLPFVVASLALLGALARRR